MNLLSHILNRTLADFAFVVALNLEVPEPCFFAKSRNDQAIDFV